MEKTNLKLMPSNDVTLKVRLHDIKLGTVPSRDKDGHHIFFPRKLWRSSFL